MPSIINNVLIVGASLLIEVHSKYQECLFVNSLVVYAMEVDNKSKLKHIFFTIKYITKFAYSVHPKLFIGVMIINILWGLSSVPGFYIERAIIDTLIKNIGTDNIQVAIYSVTFFVVLFLLLQFARSVLGSLNSIFRNVISRLLDMEMVAQIGVKQAELDLATIEDPEFKDKFDRIEKEVSRRSWGLMLSITDIPNYLIGFLSGVIVISLIHPLLSLGIILVSIPQVFGSIRFVREEHELNKTIAPKRRMWSWLNSYLMRNNNYMELKILNLASFMEKKMNELGHFIAGESLKIRKKREMTNILTETPLVLFELGISIFLIFQVLVAKITIGTFQLYLRSLRLAQSNFSSLVMTFSTIYESYVYINDLMWLMNLEPKLEKSDGKKEKIGTVESIEFDNVYFKYRKYAKIHTQGCEF